MCARGTGHCNVLIFKAQTQLRRPEKTRHLHDTVVAGRRFLPRNIPTLQTRANTIAQWEIKNKFT